MKTSFLLSVLSIFLTGCRSQIPYQPQTTALTVEKAEYSVTRFLTTQPRKRWNPAPTNVKYETDRIVFGRDVPVIIYWSDVTELKIHPRRRLGGAEHYVDIYKGDRFLYRVFTETLPDAKLFVDNFTYLRGYYRDKSKSGAIAMKATELNTGTHP